MALATPEEVIAKLGASASARESTLDWLRQLQSAKIDEETDLRNQEKREILKMRKWWSYCVLVFIGIIVIFDITLVILYGFKVLSFDDSNVVIAVVVDGLLKIVGLGYLITKNIFEKLFS
jgi:hypothetical protein